jgi:hypothetical protein
VVSLEFRLSEESSPLAVRSIVRYRRGFLHGLEFLGLTDEQQTQIRDFCAELAPSA